MSGAVQGLIHNQFIYNGLVSYWKMEGNSNDSMGVNNGVDTSVIYNTGNGKIGQGAGFTYSSSSRVRTNLTTNSLFGDSFTISLWVKPTSPQGSSIVTLFDYDHGALTNFTIQSETATTTKKYHLAWYNGASFQGGGTIGVPLTDGVWNHVVYTKNGTTVRGYLNNVSNYTSTGSGTISNSTRNITIGNWQSNTRTFNGAIDEIGFWNRVLSTNEISVLYSSGVGSTF